MCNLILIYWFQKKSRTHEKFTLEWKISTFRTSLFKFEEQQLSQGNHKNLLRAQMNSSIYAEAQK